MTTQQSSQPKSHEQQIYELKNETKRLRESIDLLEAMVRRAAREMKSGQKDLLSDLEHLLKDVPR